MIVISLIARLILKNVFHLALAKAMKLHSSLVPLSPVFRSGEQKFSKKSPTKG